MLILLAELELFDIIEEDIVDMESEESDILELDISLLISMLLELEELGILLIIELDTETILELIIEFELFSELDELIDIEFEELEFELTGAELTPTEIGIILKVLLFEIMSWHGLVKTTEFKSVALMLA